MKEEITIKINGELAWKLLFIAISAVFVYTQIFNVSIWPLSALGAAIGAKQTAPPNYGNAASSDAADANAIQSAVLPAEGVALPIDWQNFGKQLVDSGVIDKVKFESIYAGRGGLSQEEQNMLYGKNNKNVVLTNQNAGFLLNLLWAFGLANKNPILENGPMQDPQYGGAANFASTGGWTLAQGDAMQYYSKYSLLKLTADQQALVEKVSKNIYRPCCGNSTYFPDCNHGMAMLALVELMAANNVSETDMYEAALIVNSFWFPDNYLTVAKYFSDQGYQWDTLDARTILGAEYSSSAGFRNIANQTEPIVPLGGGGGCGV